MMPENLNTAMMPENLNTASDHSPEKSHGHHKTPLQQRGVRPAR